jgi:hypothetical protein
MHKQAWGNFVCMLSISRVKDIFGLFFSKCFHGFSFVFSQVLGVFLYPLSCRLLPKFHNPNNNKFFILNINNYLGG